MYIGEVEQTVCERSSRHSTNLCTYNVLRICFGDPSYANVAVTDSLDLEFFTKKSVRMTLHHGASSRERSRHCTNLKDPMFVCQLVPCPEQSFEKLENLTRLSSR